MSPNAHIPSHRKPRTAASTRALRAGVTGGILTLAVAGTSSMTANAAEPAPVESTLEMPTVSATLASTAAQAADSTEQAAFGYELQAQQDEADDEARSAVKKAKVEAEAKHKAEQARAEAARKAAERRAAQEKAEQERAARSAERTSLSTKSTEEATPATPEADSPSSSTPTGGNVATVISFLKAQVGKAYVLGATGPSAYDCSGLTQAAFNQIGISLPRVSQSQSTVGTQVSLDALQPGDILYWGSAGSAYHVAVYIGDGKFIGAQNPSTGIVERDLSYDMPTGAVRVL
ncbi:NlpC/P60 family protein [Streptomyces sp. LX-29]|uniref:C40 family peptidase n=1 Tax=Streptomyces sp. LX-29 TaxID=2900152 RepID=UPI00240D334B|nr:C40 family peptidase [Streptomyces sp. LX-29]WFB08030.1 NlpC/P60 family protein [Streptomyces sp. LX-29]